MAVQVCRHAQLESVRIELIASTGAKYEVIRNALILRIVCATGVRHA